MSLALSGDGIEFPHPWSSASSRSGARTTGFCYTGQMAALRVYRFLCGALGVGFVLVGLTAVVAFFAYHMPESDPAIPTGPVGFYFIAFSGCALIAWGGCLLAAARRPEGARGIGTATALGLVLAAVCRMAAWIVGDYHVFPGELLRAEAAAMLVLALAFVWLRPPLIAREA